MKHKELTGDEKILWIGLHLMNGVGAATFWRLIDHFGTVDGVLRSSLQERQAVEGVFPKNLGGIGCRDQIFSLGESVLERAEAGNIRVICALDEKYPARLREIGDAPPVLFVQGDLDILTGVSIAIVGSRAATRYGRRVAERLAGELAQNGVTVVSGLALGIDSEAHVGALAGGGTTVAVLGCGVDVIYPKKNERLYGEIRERGSLVSEYPPGCRPDGFRFPARNRIIAGLSEGVVVVEAARKSGSLITAQLALDYNREVFAVPGQVDSFKSEGAHWLLKQGAKLVDRGSDILEELGIQYQMKNPQENATTSSEIEGDVAVMGVLEAYPMGRDDIIEKTGIRPEKLSEILLLLELGGKVEILPGDKVRKLF